MEIPHYDIGRVGSVADQHHDALLPGQLSVLAAEEEDKKREQDEDHDIDDIFHDEADRRDHRRSAKDQKDIEDIRADHVSDGHIELVLSGSYYGCHKLRKAGSESNYGKPYQGFRKSGHTGDPYRALNYPVSAELDGDDAAGYEYEAEPDRTVLDIGFFFFFSLYFLFCL